ncbi:AAA family ATPase [Alkalihalobacillus sp. AL-G]|uniref:AAA family ATPase n=1 Tax=Alkalihalobacillus sp. AL-G TaxID=2926399 RepID=UPI002729E9C1|nr:AAA family ATPase [Alkalihalobacillus sp. AL-G]WLD94663.1 AAA family ATPase [Alkalihalobacillus sp. AL-G]
MIIMINGAFGVGKTSVANELVNAIGNSMLYDPEEVGYMLRNIVTEDVMLPGERTGDFQDIELWKILTVNVAQLLKKRYGKNLIVPMTIYDKERFQYIYKGFKQLDKQTFHFCLNAEEETIYERLEKRGEKEGNWCFQQTKKCVEAFKSKCFQELIKTDKLSVKEVSSQIVDHVKSRSSYKSYGGIENDGSEPLIPQKNRLSGK